MRNFFKNFMSKQNNLQTNKNQMNPLLETIANQASQDLLDQIENAEKKLLTAIHEAEQESQLQETPMRFNIGFKISLDMQKRILTNTLSWNVKQSLEVSHKLDDPAQGKLAIEKSSKN